MAEETCGVDGGGSAKGGGGGGGRLEGRGGLGLG